VPVGAKIFFLTIASGPALGPTQPLIQWVPEALSLSIKRPGREVNHSPPSSAKVKNVCEAVPPLHNTPAWRGAQLKKKQRDNFNFLLFSLAMLFAVNVCQLHFCFQMWIHWPYCTFQSWFLKRSLLLAKEGGH
jgi:hypothetical protein